MKTRNLGYPRIGRKRELKQALEGFWDHSVEREALFQTGAELCASRWQRQHDLGVDQIPLDFSFYDPMLDMAYLLGAIPKRFEEPRTDWLGLYFSMARGSEGTPPLSMLKWFNTNYHYLVPELDASLKFEPRWHKWQFEITESRRFPGFAFHPVLVGPWTFVKMSRLLNGWTMSQALTRIVPVYVEILKMFVKEGLREIQLDEPALCLDMLKEDLRTVRKTYDELSQAGAQLTVATYYESPEPWCIELSTLPVSRLHFDLTCGAKTLAWLKTRAFPKDKCLSLGVVSGRNVWATPLLELRDTLQEVVAFYGESKIAISPSCSLASLPIDRTLERQWDNEFASWVSFADQRLEELSYLKRALTGDRAVDILLKQRQASLAARTLSPRVHRGEVKQSVARLDPTTCQRSVSFSRRAEAQAKLLSLPVLPTTTVGSFPQTAEVRRVRQEWRKGKISDDQYKKSLEGEIQRIISLQEGLGLDVLVHGEPERPDMVEYFAEALEGIAFSNHGWVQSYGSRCVKPPLLFGDVRRRAPITVDWFRYAQGLTQKPVKAILTGPVTMLSWSFVRDDQSKDKTAFQLAIALRDEVKDLEAAGARVIQIDEAALREGLPLKHANRNQYLRWAVDAFHICVSGVKPETQIQAHMCYSEFSDIVEAVIKLDADVLLIEHARSGPAMLEAFKKSRYPNAIGPGVYDIHSPTIPTVESIAASLQELLKVFPAARLWVTPDCGLKTRSYEQVEGALRAMVDAAAQLRAKLRKRPAPTRLTAAGADKSR